jgi:predicted FMN-binding regulatory protein PaiB
MNQVLGSLVVITRTILDINHLTFFLNRMEWNNVFVFFHVSTSYKNELVSHISRTFEEFVLSLSW